MGFQYSADDLYSYKNEIFKSIDKMEEMAGTIMEKAQPAFQDPYWTGQTAEKFKSYYESVYPAVAAGLSKLSSCFKQALNMYYSLYIGNVDIDNHAVIYSDETDKLCEDLQGRDTEADTIQSAVVEKIRKVRGMADGINIKDPGIAENVLAVIKIITDMYDRIDATEGKMTSDLSGFISSYSSLCDLIVAGRNSKVSDDGRTLQFDEETIGSALISVKKAYDYLDNWQTQNEELIKLADELTELDKAHRQREGGADLFKALINAAACVADIALAFSTGGGSVVVLIIEGLVSGGIAYGANEAADQYAEKGWEEIDWDEVGLQAAYGAVAKAIGNVIGDKITSKIATPISKIPGIKQGLESQNPVLQKLTQAAAGAGSTFIGDVGGGFAENSVVQWANTGEIDVGSALVDSVSDPEPTVDAVVNFFVELSGVRK